jgi:hypothetical protein
VEIYSKTKEVVEHTSRKLINAAVWQVKIFFSCAFTNILSPDHRGEKDRSSHMVTLRTCSPNGAMPVQTEILGKEEESTITYQPEETIKLIAQIFCLKDGFAPPSRHLGVMIEKWCFPGDEHAKTLGD